MGQRKITIQDSEISHAVRYLQRRIKGVSIDLTGNPSDQKVLSELSAIVLMKDKKERVASFGAWCDRYLELVDWTKLLAVLRKQRQREADSGNSQQVSLSANALELLKRIAYRENLTYSEVLEKHLSKALRPPSRRR